MDATLVVSEDAFEMTGRDDSRAATPSDDRDAPFEEATPLEAACKLLFGEDEAPRIMRALSTATDLEARREAAETPGERARDHGTTTRVLLVMGTTKT